MKVGVVGFHPVGEKLYRLGRLVEPVLDHLFRLGPVRRFDRYILLFRVGEQGGIGSTFM